MCGIVGYTGHVQAAPVLLDGLARLEYRGYDSAGLAVRNGTDPAEVVKVGQKLKVTVLEVDVARKRISLSARSNPQIGPRPPRGDRGPGGPRGGYGRGGYGREVDRDGGQVWRSGPSGFSSNPFSGL